MALKTRKITAYACFDCDEITTGYLDMYARREPLLIFLDKDAALRRQRGIVGDLHEVEIKIGRRVKE